MPDGMTKRQHNDALLVQRRQLLRALKAYPDDVVFLVGYFVSEEEINLV